MHRPTPPLSPPPPAHLAGVAWVAQRARWQLGAGLARVAHQALPHHAALAQVRRFKAAIAALHAAGHALAASRLQRKAVDAVGAGCGWVSLQANEAKGGVNKKPATNAIRDGWHSPYFALAIVSAIAIHASNAAKRGLALAVLVVMLVPIEAAAATFITISLAVRALCAAL